MFFVRRLFAAVLAASALLVGAVSSASASTNIASYGSPGWVSARTVGIAAPPSTDIFNQATTSWTAGVGFDTLWLYASPASSQTQVVTVTNNIRECSWALSYSCWWDSPHTGAWYVTPGGWRSVSNKNPLDATFVWGSGQLFFARLTITWRTQSGVYLGQRVVDYRDAADGYCATAHCSFSGSAPGQYWYTFQY